MANQDKVVFEISAIDNATKVFRQVADAAKSLEKNYQTLKNVFEAAIVGLAIERVISATVEWERANNRLTATLRATGGAVGLTRRELDEMAVSMSKTTEFSEKQITNAEAALISFGGIHEEVFKGALKDTADLAAKMGTDLVSAAQLVGRAYHDPVLGLKAFQKELGTLTFSEKEYIAQLEANGKTEEAQLAIHDLIQRKIGGTAELMNTGLTKAVMDNQKAWEELERSLGNWSKGAIVGSANAITNWVQGVKAFATAARSGTLSLNPAANRANMEHPGGSGASGSWGDSEAQEAAKAASADAKAQEAKDRLNEAWAKATPAIDLWRKKLTETTHEELALDEVTKGVGKTFIEGAKQQILGIARLLDLRKVLGTYAEGLKEYFSAQEKADTALTSFNEVTSKAAEDEKFQISMIGRTVVEVQKLTAARKIELEAIRKEGEINAELFPEQFRAIVEAAKNAKKVSDDLIDSRREKERSWATGTKTAFDDYIEHATNAAEQSKMLFTNAFKGMEDALVSFAMTGKLDFRSFADSVVADLVRIQVRQALAGFASSTGLATLFGGTVAPAVDASVFVGHSGGVVGDIHDSRSVHASLLPYAGRYHSGLAPDERLGIFQTGERIIPRGGSGGTYYVDARGADAAAVARLEVVVRQLNGSIEYRALGAMQRAYNLRGAKTPMG